MLLYFYNSISKILKTVINAYEVGELALKVDTVSSLYAYPRPGRHSLNRTTKRITLITI